MKKHLIHIDATAGWGKTTAIERDIMKYAEFSFLWAPDRALYLVFTRRNAESARKRLSGYVRPENIRTLHSLCYSFLPEKKPVMDGKLLEEFAREYRYRGFSSGMFFTPRTKEDRMLALYYYVRNTGTEPFGKDFFLFKRTYLKEHGISESELRTFFGRWVSFKKEKNAIDYADILEMSRPSFSGIYVAVDEAQDLTPLMWKALEKLIGNSPNLRRLVIVGDCDQSIYEFQGADPLYFLNYPQILASKYNFTYHKWNTRHISRRVPSKPLGFALGFLKPVKYRDHTKEILPAREGGEVLVMRRNDFLELAVRSFFEGRIVVIQERHRHELVWWAEKLGRNGIPYCYGYDEYYFRFKAYQMLLEGKKPHLNLWRVFKDSVLGSNSYDEYLREREQIYEAWKQHRERWIDAVRDQNLRNFLKNPYGLIILSTMHSQKGEEGDVVWVSGKWTKKIKPTDNERKLYFTACTRTKDILVLDRENLKNILSLQSTKNAQLL